MRGIDPARVHNVLGYTIGGQWPGVRDVIVSGWDNQAVVRTDDGLLYEVEVDEPRLARAGAGRGVMASFDRGVGEIISDVSRTILSQLEGSAAAPDGAEIEFGLKINAEAGFIVSATPDSGQFRVRLTFQRRITPGAGYREDDRE